MQKRENKIRTLNEQGSHLAVINNTSNDGKGL